LIANRPWALALFTVEERLEIALGVAVQRVRNGDCRVRERPLGRSGSRPAAEGDRLHESVSPQPVRAVAGDAGALARGVEALDRRLTLKVGVDPAHVVVGAGPHR